MSIRHAPRPGDGGSPSDEATRVELAELGVKVKEIHGELRELVIAFEKLRHRVESVEHRLADPE
jgi:hypothetical protein